MIIFILTVGLSVSFLVAEDFSFIGIKWSDDLNTVRGKIKQSGLASDTRWMILERESTPLNAIIKNPMIDEERSKELTHIADKFKKELRVEHQLKYIEFHGKRESIVKNAVFFFAYDRDALLAYNLFLNTPRGKVTYETGEEFYQDLVKKYGAPTRTLEHSKVWSTHDQSLYYTPINETVSVTYVSELNLSAYIDRMGGKPKEADQKNQEVRPGEIRVIY